MPTIQHDHNANAVLYIRVPGHIKNAAAQAAEAEGIPTTTWCANIIRQALQTKQQLPPPPPAHKPLPTPSETLHAYLTGQTIITPCGKLNSCTGLTDPPDSLAGLNYCHDCGIRLT